jgi:hypothetical protein
MRVYRRAQNGEVDSVTSAKLPESSGRGKPGRTGLQADPSAGPASSIAAIRTPFLLQVPTMTGEREPFQGDYSFIIFSDSPVPKLRRSARRKVLHNSTGKDERFLRMAGNLRHGNGPSF